MSLINDALKRASQSDRSRPAQAAVAGLMQPVAPRPRASASWLLAAIVVGALGVALAGLFFWKWWGAGHPIVAAASFQPPQTAAAQSPPPANKPAPLVEKSPPPTAAPSSAPAPNAWPINLTVKAIFYSKTSPHALVNGITVGTGDRIGDVLVTGILSDRVFVDWNGQSKVLIMSGQ